MAAFLEDKFKIKSSLSQETNLHLQQKSAYK